MGKIAIIDQETRKIWKIANFKDTEFFFLNFIHLDNRCVEIAFSNKLSSENYYFSMSFGYFSDSQKI